MTIREKVDELGKIKAKLASLYDREQQLIGELKKRGAGRRIGSLFEANIWLQNRTCTDWWGVSIEAKIPQRIIKKHTRATPTLICDVSARRTKRGTPNSTRIR